MKTIARRWNAITDRSRVRIARSMAVSAAAIGAVSIWAYVVQGEAGYLFLEGRLFEDWVLHNAVLGAFGMSLLVWFAIPAEPRNGAVWALTWSTLFQAINAGANAWALVAADGAGIEGRVGELPMNEIPMSVGIPQQLATWTWVPGLVLLITLVLLLLPNGKLLSRRWLPVAWGSVVSMATLSAVLFWLARPAQSTTTTFVDALAPAWLGPLFLPVLGSALACTVGLIVRYRRSAGEERLRLRWIAWGGTLFGLSILTFPISAHTPGGGSLFQILSLLTGSVLLASIFVSVTKYRLYDIDIVASRTLAFGLLLGFIGGLYVAVVYGFGSIVAGDGQISFDIQIIATVAVAIAFQPARRRAQAWANRLVYGQRATPYEVLATFSHGAAEASDDELVQRAPRLIVDGTAATEATIWLESGDVFRETGSSRGATGRAIPVSPVFIDPEADYSAPIYHDGDLLGGLSLVMHQEEELPPQEAELVEQLAAGLGLALRNARLTAELRRQVAELEASRERILAAADEARRDLERELDSGPQQQLVALKVKLGPIRMRAEGLGAEKTSGLLQQLETEAGAAIKAVRDFSSGVYPPLLEAEGVVTAINQRIQGATLPIQVMEHDVGRYPREVEAAVYFAILESLQNVAKYANPSSVQVIVGDADGVLSFEVRDDGQGFDAGDVEAGSGLVNMADRLDAVGGNLTIESTPGLGTLVSGSVPVQEMAPA